MRAWRCRQASEASAPCRGPNLIAHNGGSIWGKKRWKHGRSGHGRDAGGPMDDETRNVYTASAGNESKAGSVVGSNPRVRAKQVTTGVAGQAERHNVDI